MSNACQTNVSQVIISRYQINKSLLNCKLQVLRNFSLRSEAIAIAHQKRVGRISATLPARKELTRLCTGRKVGTERSRSRSSFRASSFRRFTQRSWRLLFSRGVHSPLHRAAATSGRVSFSFLPRKARYPVIRRSSEHTVQRNGKLWRAERLLVGWGMGGGRKVGWWARRKKSRHKSALHATRPRRPSSLFRGRAVRQTEIKESRRNERRKEADWRTIKRRRWVTSSVRWPCHWPRLLGRGSFPSSFSGFARFPQTRGVSPLSVIF